MLGKYTVERVLGSGGMGVVVAARHRDLQEVFAIKFLLPEALADDSAVERFLREARSAARLKGEHVVRVHDVGRLDSGAPYMLMEHLSGCDLRVLLRSRGPLPVVEASGYVLQVCEAIAEAHAEGIVHRDLKPANLFLVRRSHGRSCMKVLDFGISKQLKDGAPDLTQAGALLGSPMYMSPEQMIRTKEVDGRSDIWALGVVLYELVTGVSPFAAESMPEIIGRVLQEEPPALSQLRSGIPAAFDALVARCLQKQPAARFQAVGELAEALQDLLGALQAQRMSALPTTTTTSRDMPRPHATPWPGSPVPASTPSGVASTPPPAASTPSGVASTPPSAASAPPSAASTPPSAASTPPSAASTPPSRALRAAPGATTVGAGWGLTGPRSAGEWSRRRLTALVASGSAVVALGLGGAWLATRSTQTATAAADSHAELAALKEGAPKGSEGVVSVASMAGAAAAVAQGPGTPSAPERDASERGATTKPTKKAAAPGKAGASKAGPADPAAAKPSASPATPAAPAGARSNKWGSMM